MGSSNSGLVLSTLEVLILEQNSLTHPITCIDWKFRVVLVSTVSSLGLRLLHVYRYLSGRWRWWYRVMPAGGQDKYCHFPTPSTRSQAEVSIQSSLLLLVNWKAYSVKFGRYWLKSKFKINLYLPWRNWKMQIGVVRQWIPIVPFVIWYM